MTEKSEPLKLKIFNIVLFFLYATYFLAVLGISYLDTNRIRTFSLFIQLVISSILMLRFNPFNHHEMTDFDRTIIFSSACFLFINLFVTEIYSNIHNSNKNINTILDKIKTLEIQ
jgi:hypothetical protein